MDDMPKLHTVDEFLERGFGGANPQLREMLLARTTSVLRRRRWRRRVSIAGALAASFLAGMVTMRFALPANDPPQPDLAHQPAPSVQSPALAEAKAPAAPQRESVLELEWRAFESADKRAELYRQAGDRYLLEHRDVQSALRCYRQALDAGTAESLTISASDNWLLIALKEARQKEKNHDRNGS
jgi:hypothetical protein